MRISHVVVALVSALAITGCQHASDPAERSAQLVAERTSAAPAPAPAAMAPMSHAAPMDMAGMAGGSCGGSCGGSAGGACGGATGGSCACGGGCMAANLPAAPAAPVPADAVWAELHVEGMHCGGCARRIQTALAKIDGVVGSEVDLGKKSVRVAARAGADPVALATPAIDQLGYRVVR